ncbi:MAG: putative toxin-antitoxin system toxin component, PIN family [Pyrinomonadaceae bacterium]
MRVVIDTNVLVAATRSQLGASHKLVRMLPDRRFQPAVSVTLYLEYLDVLLRPQNILPGKTAQNALSFIRRFLAFSHRQDIHFTWRPTLKDPNDDFVLELAIASQSLYIVTFNKKDFGNIELFGIEAVTPDEFLKLMESI